MLKDIYKIIDTHVMVWTTQSYHLKNKLYSNWKSLLSSLFVLLIFMSYSSSQARNVLLQKH